MQTPIILIGFDNYLPADKILAIFSSKTRAVKPMISSAKMNQKLIDASFGRSVKSVILTTDDFIVLSGINPGTLAERYAEKTGKKILSCGGNNHIPNEQITAILQINSQPIKEMIKMARALDKVINAKMGKATKSIIATSNGYFILSFLSPSTLAGRFEKEEK